MGNKRKRRSQDHSSAPAKKSKAEESVFLDKSPFDAERNPKREGTLYKSLGSYDPEERLNAAETILSALFDQEIPLRVFQRHLEHYLFESRKVL